MTCVRTAAFRFGAALTVVAAGLTSSSAISSAEPGTHQVRYTVSTGLEVNLNLIYLATEPPSQAAYNANPSAFLRNERFTISPGAPWVFETALTDTSWAYVMAGGATHYNGSPNPHCDIAIDGQVVTQQDGEAGAQCALKQW